MTTDAAPALAHLATLPAAPPAAALKALPSLVSRLVRDGTPDEILTARDHAEALRVLARNIRLGLEAQNTAAEARIRLERRLGEMLRDSNIRRGRKTNVVSDDNLRLTDFGVSRDLSARAQRIALVPTRFFERYFDEAKRLRFEISTRDFIERIEMYRGVDAPAPAYPSQSSWSGKISSRFLGKGLMASNIDFENSTCDWFTPKEIFDAMEVEFDIDVASPGGDTVPWIPAAKHYTKEEDGLEQDWRGKFCWMNCPYGERNWVFEWIWKFIENANGVALVTDFTSTEWWHTLTGPADAVLFVKPKIQFLPRQAGRMNALGSSLVAIGDKGVRALQNAERNGRGLSFYRKSPQCSGV